MWKNYLRIAFRNISRNVTYVGVNVVGLGIALACCIIAYLNFTFDRSFDTFHPEADRLYRVNLYKASNGQLYGITPMSLASHIREDIAGVEASIGLYSSVEVIKHGEQVFRERMHFVEGPFLETFHFPVVRGDKAALQDPSKILITRRTAKKYFGEADPLGKELIIYANKDYKKVLTVGGVLKDVPLNSAIQFDYLTHEDNLLEDGKPMVKDDWKPFTDVTLLKLANGTAAEDVEEPLQAYVPLQNQAREDWEVQRFVLEPFLETAHHGREIRANYLWPSFPPAAVWGPNIMALLLLLTACLNFTNTTVSLSDKRLKEMGIRKVLGGTQGQLIVQLLSESSLICLLALIAGVLIAQWLLLPYNAMWPYLELHADYLGNPGLLAFLGGTLLLTVLVAGSYPAFYISGFRPVRILQDKVRFGGNNLFTRVLLGLQIVISLVAVIGGLAFAKNAKYQKEADLGYDRDGILVLPIDGEQDYITLRNSLRENPQIQGIGGTSEHIGYHMYSEELESRGENYEALRLDIGEAYLDIMDLEVVEGRGFRPSESSDARSVLVNQRLVRDFRWADPIGRQLTIDSIDYAIIGVVNDFIQQDFFSPQRPVIFRHSRPEGYNYLLVKTAPESMPEVNAYLKETWASHFPYRPFEAFSQEEVISEAMQVSTNIKDVFLFLAVVSMLLSAIGLFALVSLNIMKRLKEIAIRRVIGATFRDIAYIINKSYLWIFVMATLVGCIGGAFFSQKLLESIFAIHVELGILLFVLSALAVFVIAVVTVGWKLREVVRVNPAEILRKD